MSLWPSRGLILRGFEIKISRGDYKRESNDPEKAETLAAYCDEWFIVTPVGLIRDVETELPPAWGLMEVDEKKKLHTRKACTATEAKAIQRPFLASLLRSAHRWMQHDMAAWIRREDIDDQIERARLQGIAEAPVELARLRQRLELCHRTIAEFKTETGIDILEHEWSPRGKELGVFVRVGEAVVGRYGVHMPAIRRQLEGLANLAKSALRDLTTLVPESETDKQ